MYQCQEIILLIYKSNTLQNKFDWTTQRSFNYNKTCLRKIINFYFITRFSGIFLRLKYYNGGTAYG